MKTRKQTIIPYIALALLMGGAQSPLNAQMQRQLIRKSENAKMHVAGMVDIAHFRSSYLLRVNAWLRIGNKNLTNARVHAEGYRVTEETSNPGHYNLLARNYPASPGNRIDIHIQWPYPVPSAAINSYDVRAYTGTGTLLRITKPVADSSINLAVLEKIRVSWTPVTTPVIISVHDRDKPGADSLIYRRENLSDTSHFLPRSLFEAGKNYVVGVITNDSPLTFKGPVEPASRIYYSKRASVWFKTIKTSIQRRIPRKLH